MTRKCIAYVCVALFALSFAVHASDTPKTADAPKRKVKVTAKALSEITATTAQLANAKTDEATAKTEAEKYINAYQRQVAIRAAVEQALNVQVLRALMEVGETDPDVDIDMVPREEKREAVAPK